MAVRRTMRRALPGTWRRSRRSGRGCGGWLERPTPAVHGCAL